MESEMYKYTVKYYIEIKSTKQRDIASFHRIYKQMLELKLHVVLHQNFKAVV